MKIENAPTIQVTKVKAFDGKPDFYLMHYKGMFVATDDRDKAIGFCANAKRWSETAINVFITGDSDFINDLNFELNYEEESILFIWPSIGHPIYPLCLSGDIPTQRFVAAFFIVRAIVSQTFTQNKSVMITNFSPSGAQAQDVMKFQYARICALESRIEELEKLLKAKKKTWLSHFYALTSTSD